MDEKKRSTKKISKEKLKKRSTIQALIVLDLITTLLFGTLSLVISAATNISLIFCFAIILLVIIILDFALKKVFDETFDIDYIFCTEEYVEVIPLPLQKYEFLRLIKTDTTKFYATLKNELEVTVYIQNSADEKRKFFENVPLVYFDSYYSIIKPE